MGRTCPVGGAMLFLIDEAHGYMEYQSRHGGNLLKCRVSVHGVWVVVGLGIDGKETAGSEKSKPPR